MPHGEWQVEEEYILQKARCPHCDRMTWFVWKKGTKDPPQELQGFLERIGMVAV